MSEVSREAGAFMAKYFGLGRNSSVTSHGPHKVLDANKAAFEECKAKELVEVEAYNDHGSVKITATDEGWRIARERMAAIVAETFDGGTEPAEAGE